MMYSMLRVSSVHNDPYDITVPEPYANDFSVTEHELSAMQTRLQKMLSEQKHFCRPRPRCV